MLVVYGIDLVLLVSTEELLETLYEVDGVEVGVEVGVLITT